MEYPNLSDSKIIGFDIETYDPGISKKLGPGVYRKDGYMLGFSIANEQGFAEYYNLGHYDCTESERKRNIEYLKDVLSLNIPKLGANILYDVDWTENWLHIPITGQLYDVQIAESLLDENQGHYSLDFLANKYLGKGKYKTEIQEFCDNNDLKGDPRKWLYKMPYKLVRKYAIEDAREPIDIFKIQWKKMYEEELLDVFHLECNLIRAILQMRRTGVKIDVEKRDLNALKVQNYIEEIHYKLMDKYGEFNYNSSQQIAKLFNTKGIKYSQTEKGNPNIDANFLKSIKDEVSLAEDIYNIRKGDKVLNSFLLGSYNRFLCEGDLIHCSFYNTRTDNFGTRSGRLSSANPNLQQIPSKGVDTYWGQIAREVFIPFDDCWWCKIDYSQIEYRFMAHFATGPGSEEIRAAYNNNPLTDYHQYIIDLTGLKRRFAKNLNFGVAYGMGAWHMAEFFNWALDYCYEILNIYHSKATYIKPTIRMVENYAKRKGFIKTFLGRKSRLINPDKAYIMFCRLIQGSAADLMKAAMLKNFESGVFDILYPHITVHDELDVSVPKTKIGIEAMKEMQHNMETCIKIKVPIIAEPELGSNWADIEKYNPEVHHA
jgi:DNA polymerase-1